MSLFSSKQKLFVGALLAYLLVAMHIILPTPGGFGLYLAANSISWIFFSLLVFAGFSLVLKQETLVWHKGIQLFFIASAVFFIPLFFDNPQALRALPRVLAVFAGGLLWLAFLQCKFNQKQLTAILYILLFGIAVEVLIGLIQFYLLSYFDIQLFFYKPLFGRPYGSFTQPNVMASFVVTGIALALYLSVNSSFTDKRLEYLVNFCLVGGIILMVVLQSKTGYLAFILVLLTFLPILIKKASQFKQVNLSLLIGIVFGVFSLFYLQTINVKETIAKDVVRADLYKVSAQLVMEQPLTGVGYGNFERNYREFHLAKMSENKELSPPLIDLGHPHNEPLYWLVETGAIGLFALLLLMVVFIQPFLRSGFPLNNKLQLLMLMLPILLHSQLEYPFSHSITHWFYLVLIFAVISQILKEGNSENSESVENSTSENLTIKAVYLSGFVIVLTIVPYMLTTLHTQWQMEKFKQSNYLAVENIKNVINSHAWQDHYQLIIYGQGLTNGYKNQDVQALLRYINWGAEFVEHTPRLALYQNMITAIDTLEKNGVPLDVELVKMIKQDKVILYPTHLLNLQ